MKKGFTLIELMAAVLIIGILAAVAMPMYTRSTNNARLSEAVQYMTALQRSLDLYKVQHRAAVAASLANGNFRDVQLRFISCEEGACQTEHFEYFATCDDGVRPVQCRISITPLEDLAEELPRLCAQRTQNGMNITWVKQCDGDEAYCGNLEAAGFVAAACQS